MGSEQYVLAIIGLLRILKDKKILKLKLENNFQIPKIPIFTMSVPQIFSTFIIVILLSFLVCSFKLDFTRQFYLGLTTYKTNRFKTKTCDP